MRQAPGERTRLVLFLLLLRFGLVVSQCYLVSFGDIRPMFKTPVFYAVAKNGVTLQNNKKLDGCSHWCAETCVGFNYKEPQLICELFQTTYSPACR